MKITCQSCQSKYTIADEKIHGKIAKIRCRKCGETIEVDGTRLGADASAASTSMAGSELAWTVNLADDDQRTMTLPEIVEAYHSGAVTAETYLWAEGMADWAPLAEVPEIVAALGSGTPPTTDEGAEPVRDSMFHEPPYGQSYEAQSPEMGQEPTAAMARPGSGVDLFGAQDDHAGASEPPGHGSPISTPQPLGARDEQSVLFSLSALTASAPKISVPPSTTGPTEDSGLIDLNALAAKSQQSVDSAEEPAAAAPTPFMFPAALGSVEPVTTSTTPEAPASQSSKAPLYIGAGIAIAGVALALVMATRPAETPAPAPTNTAAAVAPSAEDTAEKPEATPSPTAETTPEPAESAAPAASAEEAAPVAKKPAAAKPAAKPAPKPAAKPAAAQPTTKPAAAPPPKKSSCGCAPADLQCQIRCSATGK